MAHVKPKDHVMFKRLAIVAFAASATIGLASLAATDAFAKPHGKGNHGQHGNNHHPGKGKHGKNHDGNRHRHGHRHRHGRVDVVFNRTRTPVVLRQAVSYPAVSAVKPVRGCLTKEYTETGAVLFKDNCTEEFAMNPPEETQDQASAK
jgi:hypothetical protein